MKISADEHAYDCQHSGISSAQNVQFLKDFADFVTIECALEQNASALLKIGSLPVAQGIKKIIKKSSLYYTSN